MRGQPGQTVGKGYDLARPTPESWHQHWQTLCYKAMRDVNKK